MSHIILPAEAQAIHAAARALKAIEDRCQSVSYDTIAPWNLEGMSSSEAAKYMRDKCKAIRVNAGLAQAVHGAGDELFEVVNHAANAGGCESARQTIDAWRVNDWTGVQFGVKS